MEGDGQAARLQEALAKANEFLPDALPANRSGRLTPPQAQSLERKQSSIRRVVFLAGFVIAAGAARSVSVKAVHSGPLSALNGDGAWGFLVIGLLGMGLGLFWRRYQPDIAEAAVTWVEGRGRKEIYHYDDSPDAYGYRIGGMQFDVSERGYQALVEGLRYRAYYVPHSGELVNIEVLDRATPSAAPPTTPEGAPIQKPNWGMLWHRSQTLFRWAKKHTAWGLGFRECVLDHIVRVLRRPTPSVFKWSPLRRHARVPFVFPRQVSR